MQLLEVNNVKMHFPVGSSLTSWLNDSVIRAVDGVSLSLDSGETLSVVGESGCGKTTLARLLLGLEKPTDGAVLFDGEDIGQMNRTSWKDYRLSVQAVFQDPTSSLDPKRRIGSIVSEPLIVNSKLRGRALRERVLEILDSVGLDSSVYRAFPHELSGGMRQRVAIAQALALNPKLIVLDEPVSALDVSIRAQIMNLLKDLQEEHRIAYIMIAHDLGTVRYLSDKVVAMYVGEVVEAGESESIFEMPLHPYTIALISAVGSTEDVAEKRIILGGETASPIDPPSGCRFHPRCWLRRQLDDPDRCEAEHPAIREVRPGHQVACHFVENLFHPEQRQKHLAAASAEQVLDE